MAARWSGSIADRLDRQPSRRGSRLFEFDSQRFQHGRALALASLDDGASHRRRLHVELHFVELARDLPLHTVRSGAREGNEHVPFEGRVHGIGTDSGKAVVQSFGQLQADAARRRADRLYFDGRLFVGASGTVQDTIEGDGGRLALGKVHTDDFDAVTEVDITWSEVEDGQ